LLTRCYSQTITLAEAQQVLARDKVLVDEMVWGNNKRGSPEFGFIESKMLLRFADEVEVAEALWVSFQWRKKGLKMPEHWICSVIYQRARIYAIDVQPHTKHYNSVGKGRPGYKEWIGGIHEHLWDDEQYGYAVPIEMPLDQPEVIWKKFLKRAKIYPGDFYHPDENQPELL
jgi:hypothetical protein